MKRWEDISGPTALLFLLHMQEVNSPATIQEKPMDILVTLPLLAIALTVVLSQFIRFELAAAKKLALRDELIKRYGAQEVNPQQHATAAPLQLSTVNPEHALASFSDYSNCLNELESQFETVPLAVPKNNLLHSNIIENKPENFSPNDQTREQEGVMEYYP